MVRRLAALALSLPLVCGGLLAAHSIAYRLVGTHAHSHTHDYLGRAPMAFAVLIGFSVAALAVAVRESEASLRAPAWLFALVPPLAFGVQEHLERALQGEPTAGAALEPTFLLGLVLQLPFALLAYLLARLLLGAVALVARLVAATPRLTRPTSLPSLAELALPRASVLARGFSSRGPPLLRV